MTDENVYQTGYRIPLTPELAGMAAVGRQITDLLASKLERAIRRELYPWEFPDPNPMPHFVLFPRLARIFGRGFR